VHERDRVPYGTVGRDEHDEALAALAAALLSYVAVAVVITLRGGRIGAGFSLTAVGGLIAAVINTDLALITALASSGLRISELVGIDLDDIEIRAKQVLNATGVWTDDTQSMVGERGQFRVRASKGIHLVVPRDRIQSQCGLILRTEKSVLFVVPWGRHWIIGTTDTDWSLDKAHPAASSRDIDYILEHVNRVLVTPLSREDVEGVYAGLRPLLAARARPPPPCPANMSLATRRRGSSSWREASTRHTA